MPLTYSFGFQSYAAAVSTIRMVEQYYSAAMSLGFTQEYAADVLRPELEKAASPEADDLARACHRAGRRLLVRFYIPNLPPSPQGEPAHVHRAN